MALMYYSLWFIVGFLVGGTVVYFLAFKLSSKVKLQDELTRSKRELANAKRALDEYFSNSADLFAQLDRSYRQYARYMSHSANKLSELGQELFEVNEAQRFARHATAVEAEESAEAADDGASDTPRLTRRSGADEIQEAAAPGDTPAAALVKAAPGGEKATDGGAEHEVPEAAPSSGPESGAESAAAAQPQGGEPAAAREELADRDADKDKDKDRDEGQPAADARPELKI